MNYEKDKAEARLNEITSGECLFPFVMGILNLTPDSFSDGGKFATPAEACACGVKFAADGAYIVDVGGESTRPGSAPITAEEEWRRIGPVLKMLKKENVCLSVDTYRPETAQRALDLGVDMINCVDALRAREMYRLCCQYKADLVIPSSAYEERFESIKGMLYLDPMIGFGTTRSEDRDLLRSLPEMTKRHRVLVGASRKRIAQHLAGVDSPADTLGADMAIVTWCALSGVSMVRVHDVREAVCAVNAANSLRSGFSLVKR